MVIVLSDNILAGYGLKKRQKVVVENVENGKGVTVFGYYVDDPEHFGIVEFDKDGKAISIEENPAQLKSNYCVTRFYFYDNRVVEYAKNLKPSAGGELEIIDLNRIYFENGTLNVEFLGQGVTWLDTGIHENLVDATNFIKIVETHQYRKITCFEFEWLDFQRRCAYSISADLLVLVRLLVDMCETEKYGYYHVANEGEYISWHDFRVEVYKHMVLPRRLLLLSQQNMDCAR